MSDQIINYTQYVIKNKATGLFPNAYFGAKGEKRETSDITITRLFNTIEQAQQHGYSFIKDYTILEFSYTNQNFSNFTLTEIKK